MATIIDGKKIAEETRLSIANKVEEFKKLHGALPGLAVILVGDDPASQVYVRNKKIACENVGMLSKIVQLPGDTTQEQLMSKIEELKNDSSINGILVQLPLPKHLDEKAVIESIPPAKDVDAFHKENIGKIMLGEYDFLPCTPAGIMTMLAHENIEIEGKNCVVIGRSNIVGKPMAMLLMHANGTVTVCHSRTKNLIDYTKNADIVVVAIGKAKFLTSDMIKPGAVIIDVGINRDEDGKLCGDVDFESCKKIAGAITPVPGGVGPMTITTLLQNTLIAAEKQINQ